MVNLVLGIRMVANISAQAHAGLGWHVAMVVELRSAFGDAVGREKGT